MNPHSCSPTLTVGAGPESGAVWHERRDWFRGRFRAQPPAAMSEDEIEAHFSGMPSYYWEHLTEHDLRWGIETIHGFLEQAASPEVPATAPFVSWRQFPESNRTRLMLCTWDRRGLLAKATAAFSAVRLNILQADVFTRTDNVVLDEFSVVDADGRGVVNDARLREMMFLLEGALSEPPRFASVWACSRHKFLAPAPEFDSQITFDNDPSCVGTLVRVEAPDRLGLLYDILQCLADNGLNVTQARIDTEQGHARDTFHITDEQGGQIANPVRLESIRARLEASIALKD